MIIEPTSNATVTGAIRQAARMTGADFKYLLATAQVESNLNPNAQAATSSARGLFQFTDQTWLATLKESGAPLGYGPYADAIARLPGGGYAVADPRMNGPVMKLRFDPTANALMAGAFTKANADRLSERLGREPTEGELYIAHFLGSTGASRLIGLADAQPGTPAAAMFPDAARANPSIFYDGRRNMRSANDVYRLLVGRYDVARSAPAQASPPPMVAATPAAPANAFSPDTAGLTETYAAAAKLSEAAKAAAIAPVFHGLFRTEGAAEPVAPLVSSLWTEPRPATPATPVARREPVVLPEGDGDLGLFQDQAPDARALFRGRV
jgi:hypothetical protein